MTNEHTELQEVTRNADEIQTTFIGFLLDGRVIEVGDINHKPNRENTRRIVTAVNYHHRLREALEDCRRTVEATHKARIGGGDLNQALAAQEIAERKADALLAELGNLEDRGHG